MQEPLYISDRIKRKCLTKHGLTEEVIQEAWMSYEGILLEDNREEHRTDPPTEWFLVRVRKGLILKIVVVIDFDGIAYLKSAYGPPNKGVLRIFKRTGGDI